jgi:hypothetical protein
MKVELVESSSAINIYSKLKRYRLYFVGTFSQAGRSRPSTVT